MNMRYKILDQHGLNFLTLTVVEWIDLFTRRAFADMVVESLRFCQQNKGLEVFGFVIMPSHIHLIARAGSEDELSSILQSFKSFTASKIISYLQDTTQPESRREWLLNHFAFNARKNKTNSHTRFGNATITPSFCIVRTSFGRSFYTSIKIQ